MKAYVLYGIDDLRYVDVEMPNCPEGWAFVRVKAAGICSSDIARVFTKGTYHFPTVPGHEFAGIVEKVGSEHDRRYIGKHVGVFPLIPCRECIQCQDKHYEMCAHYDYLGSRRDGGFAEYVTVPIWNLLIVDENLPFTSVAMLEPLSVALHAMKQCMTLSQKTVGIIGTGMIGICAAQWAKLLGASEVTVVGRNESKRGIVENCGIDYIVPGTKDGIGRYDVVLEAVGTPEAIEHAIYSTKPGGELILMGNPSGDIKLMQNAYWYILRKQLRVYGTWNSVYDGINQSDWTEVVDAMSSNKINISTLISHVFSQEDLMKGLQIMRNHKESYCKIMTLWNQK
mgnify:CR=1 FL=1